MTNEYNARPRPADLLFDNLFECCPTTESFKLIAEGIFASYKNAGRLLSDAEYLSGGGRLSSARFILATAREEIAKSYILLDTCMLDWKKHIPELRGLCRAFYDHIAKHAYLEMPRFSNINSMVEAKDIWDVEVRRWWPADYGDGEPDMPHDTVFNRELPLYVDYGDYDRCWRVPTDSDQSIYFMFKGILGETPISSTRELINRWKQAESVDICSPQVLAILNAVFKKRYFREDTTRRQLYSLYKEVARRVSLETDISLDLFMTSPLVRWPLYRFVARHQGKKNRGKRESCLKSSEQTD